MKVASVVGLVASLLTAYTGDNSGYRVSQVQPMKLAAMEALYDGGHSAPLTVVGPIKIPNMLSFLATRTIDGFVPGINDLLDGGYTQADGTKALSVDEKIKKGKQAIVALAEYRKAAGEKNESKRVEAQQVLDENMKYFGYGYIKDRNEIVPNVWLLFWSFRVMVGLGTFFIALFVVILFMERKKMLDKYPLVQYGLICCIPLAYLASQAGWIVAEVGRQPWTIQDMLPVGAAISKLDVGSVQTTFFIFLIMFTVLLIAEIRIMLKAIKKGPEEVTSDNH